MELLKKLFVTNSRLLARSRNILLFTLIVSIVLNLVLFIRISHRANPNIARINLQETIAEFKLLQAVENQTVDHESKISAREHRNEQPLEQLPTELPITISPSHATRDPKSACPLMTIHKDGGSPFHNTVCRPHLPAEDACVFAAKLFKHQPSIAKCHDQKGSPHQLCRVTEIRNGVRLSPPEVTCDASVCLKTADIKMLIVDPSDGNYLQLELPGSSSNSDIQETVKKAIPLTRNNGYNFLFIDCVGRKNKEKISQLLTFIPDEKIFKPDPKSSADKVNVNVVLLDSISRPQFFRSLPKTASFLRQKSDDPKFAAHIFDFEMFQSVHGHTHENEHALFGGALYPENFTKSDKERAPTNMERLFGIFKDAGYQTMAQNDLCWKSWYGFLTSFMAEKWTDLQEIMRKTIDSTGLTDASCRILEQYKKTTAFNDNDDHQICYNGKHHHRYLFDNLANYLKAVTTLKPSKPLFSYTETNVAHDDVGIRVQTLDSDLTDLINSVSQLPNTFTIIYADHGNTYTEYQVSMLEGRMEMYHPIMLGILPKDLGRKLGVNVVENLKINQHRLLHLFDIRESLVELAKYDTKSRLNPVGIFGKIPKDRTCNDLKLSTPNFCICDGWDTPVENSTVQVALAEFAIGQLNNQLQEALLASRQNELRGNVLSMFGACKRLQLQGIKNARQHPTPRGTMVTTIDVKLQSGNIVDQEEIITVQVESAQIADRSSFDMRLITHNRISHYSIYEECADPGLPLNLCICDKRDTKGRPRNDTVIHDMPKKTEFRKLKPCLLLLKRQYSENKGEEDYVGVEVYELANICEGKQFTVKIGAETENVRASTELPVKIALPPKTIYFGTIMMTEVGYVDVKLKLRLRVVTENLDTEKKSGENGGKQVENGKRSSKRKRI